MCKPLPSSLPRSHFIARHSTARAIRLRGTCNAWETTFIYPRLPSLRRQGHLGAFASPFTRGISRPAPAVFGRGRGGGRTGGVGGHGGGGNSHGSRSGCGGPGGRIGGCWGYSNRSCGQPSSSPLTLSRAGATQWADPASNTPPSSLSRASSRLGHTCVNHTSPRLSPFPFFSNISTQRPT